MALQVTGWLPYGSDDPSVVFTHPLTRPIVAADISGLWTSLLFVGSGNNATHHPTLGMKAYDSAGVDTGYRLATPSSVITPLDQAGQMCFEVERDFVCLSDAANGSTGVIPATTKTLLSALAATGGAQAFAQRSSGGAFLATLYSAATTGKGFKDWVVDSGVTPNGVVHSEGKPDFVTINVGWWGGRVGGTVVIAVDGLVVGANTLNSATLATLMNNFYIGSDRGSAGTFVTSHWMRNLQIASRPPVMPVHPRLRSVAYLSDSLSDNNDVTGPYRDVSGDYALRRVLNKRGLRPGAVNVSENSGYYISTVGTQLETKVATVLGFGPDVVIVCGGTNDAGSGASYVGSGFTTEYQDLLEQLFFGVAKDTRTPVQYVFCNFPPPFLAAATDSIKAANHLDVRTRIAALPAWWDATWGATYGTGRVKIINMFAALGASHGLMADPALSPDGTHYAWKGNRIYGETVARELLNNLVGI